MPFVSDEVEKKVLQGANFGRVLPLDLHDICWDASARVVDHVKRSHHQLILIHPYDGFRQKQIPNLFINGADIVNHEIPEAKITTP